MLTKLIPCALALLLFSCAGEKRSMGPIEGEWMIQSNEGGRKHIIRIDDKYFQELTKENDDSSTWAAITYAYQLKGDTLNTNDINFRTKKLYAWNAFFITEKSPDKLKMRTLFGELLTLNRVHSDFDRVDTTLDAVLAKMKLQLDN